MPFPGRRGAPVDWLIVGLGNPGAEYDGTPPQHRLRGRERARRSAGICRSPNRSTAGCSPRAGPARVARGSRSCCPRRYMNEAGTSVGPARGALKVALDHVLVVHDEIDLPFGEIRARTRRRPGRPQRPEVAQSRARVGRFPPRADRRRAARRPPIPTASPPTSSAGSASRRPTSQALIEEAADAAERIVLGDARRRPRLDRGCSAPSSPTPTTIRRPPRSQRDGGRAFVSQSLRPYLLAALLDARRRRGRRSWSPATTAPRATSRRGLRTWLEPRTVRYYPSRGVTYESHLAPPPHLVGLRIAALDALLEDDRADSRAPVVVVSAVALSEKVPDPALRPHGFALRAGELLDLDETARDLVAAGYERVDQVEDRGPVRDPRRPARRVSRPPRTAPSGSICSATRSSRCDGSPPSPSARWATPSVVEIAPAAELAEEHRELAEIAALEDEADRPGHRRAAPGRGLPSLPRRWPRAERPGPDRRRGGRRAGAGRPLAGRDAPRSTTTTPATCTSRPTRSTPSSNERARIRSRASTRTSRSRSAPRPRTSRPAA